MSVSKRKSHIVAAIISAVLLMSCLGGCWYVSKREDSKKNEVSRQISEMQHLTNNKRVMDAINAEQKEVCVIQRFKFPKVVTVTDRYGYLDGEYLFVCREEMYKHKEKGKKGKVEVKWKTGYTWSNSGEVCFDNNIPLEDLGRAFFVCRNVDKGCDLDTAKRQIDRDQKRIKYYYMTPDAELSFIAELGGHRARIVGLNGGRGCIVEGSVEDLAAQYRSNESLEKYKLWLAFAIIILAGILWYELDKSKKKKY